MTASTQVTMAMGCISDNWISSTTYFENLSQALLQIAPDDFDLKTFRSNLTGPGVLRRRFLYPRELHRNVNGPLHLTDQSYADALLGYRGPSVLTVNDIAFWHERGANPLRQLMRRRIVQGIRKARHCLSISEFTRQEMIEHLNIDPSQVTSILYSINDTWLRPAGDLPENLKEEIGVDPYLLHVGSLIPRKGMAKFMKAYALNPGFPRLVQVGGEPDWELRDVIKQHGLEKKVLFLGYQELEDVKALVACAEVFVFPSSFEGYGIPPIEAHVQGTKIFTTEMPSIREHLNRAPEIRYEQDVNEWATQLERVINSPQPTPPTAEELYKFSWQRQAREVLDIYKKHLLED